MSTKQKGPVRKRNGGKSAPRKLKHGKYHPAPGRDFGIYTPQQRSKELEAIVQSQDHLQSAITRDFLARAVVLCILLGIAAAGLYGLFTDNLDHLSHTWSALSPALFFVLGSYMKPKKRE